MVLLLALLLGCDSDDDMREIQACADEGVNVFAPAGRIPVAALVGAAALSVIARVLRPRERP